VHELLSSKGYQTELMPNIWPLSCPPSARHFFALHTAGGGDDPHRFDPFSLAPLRRGFLLLSRNGQAPGCVIKNGPWASPQPPIAPSLGFKEPGPPVPLRGGVLCLGPFESNGDRDGRKLMQALV
jgi:hypothetical protein